MVTEANPITVCRPLGKTSEIPPFRAKMATVWIGRL